ncbi:MAG: hypothetical protein WCC81_05720, partial [Pseudolabrys sp.]
AIPAARGEDLRFILFLTSRDGRPIDLAQILATCRRELPPYKLPVHYEVVDRFPLTSGYKIDRAALALLAPRILAPNARQSYARDSLTQSQ